MRRGLVSRCSSLGKKSRTDFRARLCQSTRGDSLHRGPQCPLGWGAARKKSRYQVVPAHQNHWGFLSGASALGAVSDLGYRYLTAGPGTRLDLRPPGTLRTPRCCPAPASWPQRYPIQGATSNLAMPDRVQFGVLYCSFLNWEAQLPSFFCNHVYKCGIGLSDGRIWGSSGLWSWRCSLSSVSGWRRSFLFL